MPKYRTKLFELGVEDEDLSVFLAQTINARGWSARLESLVLRGTDEQIHKQSKDAFNLRSIVKFERIGRHRSQVTYAPEIIIQAGDRLAAQRALNLIGAAITLINAQPLFEDFGAIPLDNAHSEGMTPGMMKAALNNSVGTNGLFRATSVAAKATRRSAWTFAMAKYLVSLRTCSIHPMEHHPYRGDHYGVERDPIQVMLMSQAIVAANSAIEELGLQVRASEKVPSKVNGEWNPKVHEDLLTRLQAAGINLNEPFNWMLRGTPRAVERRYRVPVGSKSPWTRRHIRDRQIKIADAIHYAGLLRSKAGAHASGSLTRSLTLVDVSNIQDLARRLILEALGFWRNL